MRGFGEYSPSGSQSYLTLSGAVGSWLNVTAMPRTCLKGKNNKTIIPTCSKGGCKTPDETAGYLLQHHAINQVHIQYDIDAQAREQVSLQDRYKIYTRRDDFFMIPCASSQCIQRTGNLFTINGDTNDRKSTAGIIHCRELLVLQRIEIRINNVGEF